MEFTVEHAEYAGGGPGHVLLRVRGTATAPVAQRLGPPTLIVDAGGRPRRIAALPDPAYGALTVGPTPTPWRAGFALALELVDAPGGWYLEPGPALADEPVAEPAPPARDHMLDAVRVAQACLGSLRDVVAELDGMGDRVAAAEARIDALPTEPVADPAVAALTVERDTALEALAAVRAQEAATTERLKADRDAALASLAGDRDAALAELAAARAGQADASDALAAERDAALTALTADLEASAAELQAAHVREALLREEAEAAAVRERQLGEQVAAATVRERELQDRLVAAESERDELRIRLASVEERLVELEARPLPEPVAAPEALVAPAPETETPEAPEAPTPVPVPRPRRLRPTLPAALFAAGALVVADSAITLLWQEPFSALYSLRQQDELDNDLQTLENNLGEQKISLPPRPELRMRLLARELEREREAGEALGRIKIPSIGASFVVVQGTGDSALKKGPGHYATTPLPGEPGSVGIAGHRTTFGAPFRKLDKLGKGDRIEVRMPYGRFRYEVEGTRIVKPENVSVLRAIGRQRLVLTACHPLYSAAERIVVVARLVRATPRGAALRATDEPSSGTRADGAAARPQRT